MPLRTIWIANNHFQTSWWGQRIITLKSRPTGKDYPPTEGNAEWRRDEKCDERGHWRKERAITCQESRVSGENCKLIRLCFRGEDLSEGLSLRQESVCRPKHAHGWIFRHLSFPRAILKLLSHSDQMLLRRLSQWWSEVWSVCHGLGLSGNHFEDQGRIRAIEDKGCHSRDGRIDRMMKINRNLCWPIVFGGHSRVV